MRVTFVAGFLLCSFISLGSHVDAAPQTLRDQCGHTLARPTNFFERHFDWSFLKKFFKHWIPFVSRSRVKMHFYLYKRDFPECGREILVDDDPSLEVSGFDPTHPTRIIIHGWMSQSKGSLNRAVKNAYLSLTKPPETTTTTTTTETKSSENNEPSDIHEPLLNSTHVDNTTTTTPCSTLNSENDNTVEYDEMNSNNINNNTYTDFNVIVVDWSLFSSNVNYFSVVELIEDLGFLLAEFVRYLHSRTGLHYNDVYLIGHSLGAQIAGSAGKQVKPFRFNTIFALDPAGPKFRERDDEYRIDPSDAEYVESIQTSSSLGFQDPVGHATFYPNFGHDQKKCYIYGCSHSRAHNYFAESITSRKGFWGTLCRRQTEDVWILSGSGVEFRMGGEPSTPKSGTYYVKTNGKPPYALGRHTMKGIEMLVTAPLKEESTEAPIIEDIIYV